MLPKRETPARLGWNSTSYMRSLATWYVQKKKIRCSHAEVNIKPLAVAVITENSRFSRFKIRHFIEGSCGLISDQKGQSVWSPMVFTVMGQDLSEFLEKLHVGNKCMCSVEPAGGQMIQNILRMRAPWLVCLHPLVSISCGWHWFYVYESILCLLDVNLYVPCNTVGLWFVQF